MGRRRRTESGAPFQTIEATARITGFSQVYIRRGVKSGDIPAIRAGSSSNAPYLVDVERFLEQLHREAARGAAG